MSEEIALPSGMTNLPVMLELTVETTKSTVSDSVTVITPLELAVGLLSITNVNVVFFAEEIVWLPLYVAGDAPEIVMTSLAFKPWALAVVAVTVPLVVDNEDNEIDLAN